MSTLVHAPARHLSPKQASCALWQAAKQHRGDAHRTEGPDDARDSRRRSVVEAAALALNGVPAPQLPPDLPEKRKAPDSAGTPELPPQCVRAGASSGGACAALSALGDEPDAAGARAALDISGPSAGRQLQGHEDGRQLEETPQLERPLVQTPAAAAAAVDAVPPSGVPSTPAVLAAEGQAVAQTARDVVGSRGHHVATHDGGEGGCVVRRSASARGDPGTGDQPSSGWSAQRTPLNMGQHRATRAVKDIGAEPGAQQPDEPPSPGDDLAVPSAEATAAQAAAGSDGGRSPPSIAAAVSAAGVDAEHRAGPEPGTASTLPPSRKAQKRSHMCNFCAIHGLVAVASRAHTKECQFATQCFCLQCARLGFRNRARNEATQRKLAAEAAKTAVADSHPPDELRGTAATIQGPNAYDRSRK